MLKTVYHNIVARRITDLFVTIGYFFFHSTDVSASCRVRNGCTDMLEIAVQSINRKI